MTKRDLKASVYKALKKSSFARDIKKISLFGSCLSGAPRRDSDIDLLDATNKIERYLKGTSYKSFLKDDMKIDAVVRELEIIGEAARNVSAQLKDQHSEIPWSQIMGMRNYLIHEYFGVIKKIVWETCKTDLKSLKEHMLSLLKGF